MFSCGFCEISKNTLSYRTPLVAASEPIFNLAVLFLTTVMANFASRWIGLNKEAATGGALGNFVKFTGKHLCQGLFFNKDAGLKPPLVAASEYLRDVLSEYFFQNETIVDLWVSIIVKCSQHSQENKKHSNILISLPYQDNHYLEINNKEEWHSRRWHSRKAFTF